MWEANELSYYFGGCVWFTNDYLAYAAMCVSSQLGFWTPTATAKVLQKKMALRHRWDTYNNQIWNSETSTNRDQRVCFANKNLCHELMILVCSIWKLTYSSQLSCFHKSGHVHYSGFRLIMYRNAWNEG